MKLAWVSPSWRMRYETWLNVAQAAKETAVLIEASISKSTAGKEKVGQVAVAIQTITGESRKIGTLVEEMNLTSQEQTRGFEQIAKALTQMEEVTQRNAANAEQTAASVEELNAQSETLKAIVQQLTAMVGGSTIGHATVGNRR